jgi:hypothetical protein
VTAERVWTYREHARNEFTLSYAGHDLATIRWAVELRHPHRTMLRIVEGLNTPTAQDPRTWSAKWDDPVWGAWLLHNGRPVGELRWIPRDTPIRNPARWIVRLVDGMNRDGGNADPVPEPAPPRHLRSA